MSDTPRPELYVYYKADPTQREAVLAAFADLQRGLADKLPGLQSRLLKRLPDAAEHTWMEVHTWPSGAETVVTDWVKRVESLARKAPLMASIQRHIEYFESPA